MAAETRNDLLRYLRRLLHRPEDGRTTDALLLERFVQARDEAAFAAIVERHGPMVYGVCQRVLADPHDAEDAFQATFLVLIRKAHAIGRSDLLGNWLYGVAYRVALKARGRAIKHRAQPYETQDFPMKSATDDVAWHDAQRVLDDELSRLPDKYRAPFLLCYVQGKTNGEAALEIGCPKGTVFTRLAKARELLRDRLERRGVVLSASGLTALCPQLATAATVPAALLRTVQSLVSSSIHAAAAGGASATAAALAQGVIQDMAWHKLMAAAFVALVLSVLGTGGWLLQRGLADDPSRLSDDPPVAVAARNGDKPATDNKEGPQKPVLQPVRKVAGSWCPPVFSRDGKVLVTAMGHTVTVWNAETGEKIGESKEKARIAAVAISPDGQKLAIGVCVPDTRRSDDPIKGQIHLRESATGKLLQSLEDEGRSEFHHLAFSLAGDLLAAGDRYRCKIWHLNKKKSLPIAENQDSLHLRSLALSPNGALAATGVYYQSQFGADRLDKTPTTVVLWETTTGKKRLTCEQVQFEIPDNISMLAIAPAPYAQFSPRSVTFSPDNRFLAAVACPNFGYEDNKQCCFVCLWEATTGKALRHREFEGELYAIAFSHDGKKLAVPDGKTILFIEVSSGKEMGRLHGHAKPVASVTFSADGSSLASSSLDETRIWDLRQCKPE